MQLLDFLLTVNAYTLATMKDADEFKDLFAQQATTLGASYLRVEAYAKLYVVQSVGLMNRCLASTRGR